MAIRLETNLNSVIKINHYYYFPRLNSNNLVAVFSDKTFNLGFDNNPKLIENRKKFLSQLSIDSRNLVCTKQPHNNQVKKVTSSDRGRGAADYNDALDAYDALVTNEKDLVLAIFTADCLPIFFFDPEHNAIGIAHAGWRGTKGDIAKNTINKMKEEQNTRPEDLIVGFGPCICKDCYEVGKEFKNYFSDGLIEKEEKFYLDLIKLNRIQLLDAGVRTDNIIGSSFCTSCHNDEFFSYRKEKTSCGRMMSLIMLK